MNLKKFGLLGTALLALSSEPAQARAWLVGPQTATLGNTHKLGDGTNSRGGEAPYYTAGEPNDTATAPSIVSAWTLSGFGQFSAPGSGGFEAKARFDCNITFTEKNDPILAPGVLNGSSHDHSFFGNTGAAGNAQNADYSSLRASGYSTCYGGPMNRTLYWEPTMFIERAGGVRAKLKPVNIITYYICGDFITPTGTQMGPPHCSRWPRNLEMVFGFNMADPTGTREQKVVDAANAINPGYWQMRKGTPGWSCITPNGTGITSYAPNPGKATQPYFNDGNGHATLDCKPTVVNGENVYSVNGQVVSPECWDGKNPTSPNGRDHLFYRQHSQFGGDYCPEGWYFIPHFEAKVRFDFKSIDEMSKAYLASDRMPGMTQFKGGESFHADLIPAWDYGTGDKPGFMVKFFKSCLGINMHLKNSDGVTYTDITGDPHECGFGRIDASTNTVVNAAPPDGVGPNPVVNLTPDQTGTKRFFPLTPGSVEDVTIQHKH